MKMPKFIYKKGDILFDPNTGCTIKILGRFKDCRTICYYLDNGFKGPMYNVMILKPIKKNTMLGRLLNDLHKVSVRKEFIAKDTIEKKFIFDKVATVLYA